MDSRKEPGSVSFPDLHEFPEGSLPAPVQMMNPVRRLPPGLRLVAVGWLDGSIGFPKGANHIDIVSRLLGLGDEFLISVGCGEVQTCCYCKPEVIAAARGSGRGYRPQTPKWEGHYLVRLDEVVFMCPSVLPHYVVVHGYRPPDVFQAAVLNGVFLADGDLVHTGEDFLVAALQPRLAAAELAGDRELAESYRTRIAARREQLGLTSKKSV